MRIVHLPSGLKTESRTERSQLINKEICRVRLASMIEDLNKPESIKFDEEIKFGRAKYNHWETDKFFKKGI